MAWEAEKQILESNSFKQPIIQASLLNSIELNSTAPTCFRWWHTEEQRRGSHDVEQRIQAVRIINNLKSCISCLFTARKKKCRRDRSAAHHASRFSNDFHDNDDDDEFVTMMWWKLLFFFMMGKTALSVAEDYSLFTPQWSSSAVHRTWRRRWGNMKIHFSCVFR